MPLKDAELERTAFFGDPALDNDLPRVNKAFWSSLIRHIERDCDSPPRVILDIGCHAGGLLHELSRRFAPIELLGIEPLAALRVAASRRLDGAAATVRLLDTLEWELIPTGTIELITSHEVLYLEPDVRDLMKRIRRVLAPGGAAYVVLGCHAENPLWHIWKTKLIAAGQRVYDHMPVEIMEAASSAGLLPSVQPLRCSGWVTYDPLRADFRYPDVRTMFDHHFRYKLIFRLRIAHDRTATS
ncbi:MAG TPA: class I SAM-dependent methyltransferase [Thermoanaerobaculia bacterium]|nr:class I SAM-dependent methyltransferase [Thermoanaerobaculia bacterium]